MKIAILTIQSINYGNRLQNFAMQILLEKRGFQVESIRREPSGFMSKTKRLIRSYFKNDCIEAFREFDYQLIHFSNKTVCHNVKIDLLPDDYDKYIIGSDQIWNPTFPFNSEVDYLPMIPSEKKIAYAASFGVSEISTRRNETARLLNDIPWISVREKSGAEIVRGLTGVDVPVVLDPTLLLDVEEWADLARKPNWIDPSQKFYFKYFLGNDVYDRVVFQLAESQGCSVIDVMDESLRIGPREFVWLVQNCAVVCTDSFHASAFSMISHVPLIIFERADGEADMSSRFDTMCEEFGIVGHRYTRPDFSLDAVFGTDWDAFESRLRELRGRSLGWLEGALAGGAANA